MLRRSAAAAAVSSGRAGAVPRCHCRGGAVPGSGRAVAAGAGPGVRPSRPPGATFPPRLRRPFRRRVRVRGAAGAVAPRRLRAEVSRDRDHRRDRPPARPQEPRTAPGRRRRCRAGASPRLPGGGGPAGPLRRAGRGRGLEGARGCRGELSVPSSACRCPRKREATGLSRTRLSEGSGRP